MTSGEKQLFAIFYLPFPIFHCSNPDAEQVREGHVSCTLKQKDSQAPILNGNWKLEIGK
jgi:hypothetical protein